MTSHAARFCATLLLAGTTALTAFAGTAGATTAVDPGAVIVTFSVPATPGAAQTPTVITHTINPATDDERVAVWDQMVAAAKEAAKGCGTFQVDLAANDGPWATGQVDVPFPIDAPNVLSAIPNIVGTGTCDEAPAPTTTDTLPPVEVTAPPVVTDPVPPVDVSVPAISVARGTSISIVKATSFPVGLPATGSHTVPLVMFAGSLIGAGLLLRVLGRRTI